MTAMRVAHPQEPKAQPPVTASTPEATQSPQTQPGVVGQPVSPSVPPAPSQGSHESTTDTLQHNPFGASPPPESASPAMQSWPNLLRNNETTDRQRQAGSGNREGIPVQKTSRAEDDQNVSTDPASEDNPPADETGVENGSINVGGTTGKSNMNRSGSNTGIGKAQQSQQGEKPSDSENGDAPGIGSNSGAGGGRTVNPPNPPINNSNGNQVSREQLEGWLNQTRESGNTNLNQYNNGQQINLQGMDLSGLDLSNLEINGNFTGTNLTGAKLNGANLTGSNFQGAKLNEADLRGANLQGVNLRNTSIMDTKLDGANLSGANMSGTNLTRSTLSQANLTRSDLSGAELKQANFDSVNLNHTKLDGSKNGAYTYANFPGLEQQVKDFEQQTGIKINAPDGTQHTLPAVMEGLSHFSPEMLKIAGQQGLQVDIVNNSDDPVHKLGGGYASNKIYIPTHNANESIKDTMVHEVMHFFDEYASKVNRDGKTLSANPQFEEVFKQDVVSLLGGGANAPSSGNTNQQYKALSDQFFGQFENVDDITLEKIKSRDFQSQYPNLRQQPGETDERYLDRVRINWFLMDEFRKNPDSQPEAYAEFARRSLTGKDPDVLAMYPSTTEHVNNDLNSYAEHYKQQPDNNGWWWPF